MALSTIGANQIASGSIGTNQIDTAATPTVASATVAGDLTVDTNTLYVDSTNNRVGIGTTSVHSTAQLESSGRIAGQSFETFRGYVPHSGGSASVIARLDLTNNGRFEYSTDGGTTYTAGTILFGSGRYQAHSGFIYSVVGSGAFVAYRATGILHSTNSNTGAVHSELLNHAGNYSQGATGVTATSTAGQDNFSTPTGRISWTISGGTGSAGSHNIVVTLTQFGFGTGIT